jgi:hypothetical protein
VQRQVVGLYVKLVSVVCYWLINIASQIHGIVQRQVVGLYVKLVSVVCYWLINIASRIHGICNTLFLTELQLKTQVVPNSEHAVYRL